MGSLIEKAVFALAFLFKRILLACSSSVMFGAWMLAMNKPSTAVSATKFSTLNLETSVNYPSLLGRPSPDWDRFYRFETESTNLKTFHLLCPIHVD